jgi:hypothetical protein
MSDLRISELDFDQIKANLKAYLAAKPEFTDYNFEGSGLSQLLDVLAYNTHYDAYLANMLHNEAFLDSAIKRSSVVSKAKHLSYTPRSARSATAIVDIVVNNPNGSPNFLTIDRYTQFNTSINGAAYTFVNPASITISPISGVYTFNAVELKEGKPYNLSFTVVNPGPDEKYELANDNIDTSTMFVSVQTSTSNNTRTIFTRVDDITKVNSTSNVYYLDENYRGKYEIYFGDGVLGKLLTAGNIVSVDYLITNADSANVSSTLNQTFTLSGTISGNSNVSISVLQNSTGGAQKEAINSIKFNAPRNYIAQSRAVTAEDYLSSIEANIGNVESVAVWGGEENDPPVYGKVFVSLKPYSGYVISNSTKAAIKNNVLKARNIVSITPEFVDPLYTWINLNIDVRYKYLQTTKSASQITQLVQDTITNYFSTNLQKFNADFILSKLSGLIDSADSSIVGNNIIVKVQKRIEPILNTQQSYTLSFGTRLHPNEINSTRFYVDVNGILTPARIKDLQSETPQNYEGTGVVQLYNADTGAIITNIIGTVDYPSGTMVIENLNVAGFYGDQLDIRISADVQEKSSDINVVRNNILVVDDGTLDKLANRDAGITINIISES